MKVVFRLSWVFSLVKASKGLNQVSPIRIRQWTTALVDASVVQGLGTSCKGSIIGDFQPLNLWCLFDSRCLRLHFNSMKPESHPGKGPKHYRLKPNEEDHPWDSKQCEVMHETSCSCRISLLWISCGTKAKAYCPKQSWNEEPVSCISKFTIRSPWNVCSRGGFEPRLELLGADVKL